ncbi:hypothetical protein [Bdellovibrio sp. HCB2-146]|uniref:hypothetical protein n=1 Tax=Bdellovibrio sp. HCB2-146 TaxID=3394362 RepID=UPI0039BD3509
MKLIFALLILSCLVAPQSYAGGGGYDHDNGGDMCENRFTSVRDDLKTWITKGGSADLRLPQDITLEKYNKSMLEKIETAKVSCIDQQILVRGVEKTCRNFAVAVDGSVQIQCNRNQFMSTSESDQYVLVHHEYAGLAGFEVNTSEASNYEISNQITGYLESSIVKKLAVKKSASSANDPFNPASCIGPQMSLEEARKLGKPAYGDTRIAEFKIHTRVRHCNHISDCDKWEVQNSNNVKLYDRNRNGTFALIPDTGHINLTLNEEDVSVHFLTLPGGPGVSRGLFITCGAIPRFDGTCTLSTMTRNTGLEYIGEAFGVIGASCTRLTLTQKRFILSSYEWIEQELVLTAKY